MNFKIKDRAAIKANRQAEQALALLADQIQTSEQYEAALERFHPSIRRTIAERLNPMLGTQIEREALLNDDY